MSDTKQSENSKSAFAAIGIIGAVVAALCFAFGGEGGELAGGGVVVATMIIGGLAMLVKNL
jgi:hypothetical protein